MTNADDSARRAQEDAEFERIVGSFGEAPEFPQPAAAPEPPEPQEQPEVPVELTDPVWLDDEGFVPGPPPPVPVPRGFRALAWFGFLGIPLIGLGAHVLAIPVPSPLPFLLLIGFVAGFGYLIATMGAGPADPYSGGDDGAVL